jgi:phosphomethylpyrimidine synthase
MKISQDVRDFAKAEREKGEQAAPVATTKEAAAEIEKGMQEMAEKFKQTGGEIYQKVG